MSTMLFLTAILIFVGVSLGVNPQSCSQVNCGNGQCCDDGLLGPVCYDVLKYNCSIDSLGTKTLCGSGLSTCAGVCFDPNEFICTNGVISLHIVTPSYVSPILPPVAAPVTYPAQTADFRIINSCKETLWIEARQGGEGSPLPGQTATTTQALSGSYVDYSMPATGLPGTRFWAKYGCDATGRNCVVGDQMQYWPNPPGGCPTSGCTPPVDSLFEATWGCVPGTSCNAQNPTTWFDTSQVDGWTIPYKLSANGQSNKCDCVGGTCGFYGVNASRLDLSRCPSTENMVTSTQSVAVTMGASVSLSSVDLRMINQATNQVVGCMSPCKKISWGAPYGLQQPEGSGSGLWLCCPTPTPNDCTEANGCVTPTQCRNGPIASSQYVAAVHSMAPGVYAYSYDDGVGLHTCPAGLVTYTMEFCPEGTTYPLQL